MTASYFKIVIVITFALVPAWAAAAANPQAEGMIDQGKKAYSREDYGQAVDAFEKAVMMAPDVSLYHVWLGRAYGRRAENTSKWKFFSALNLAGKTRESFERAVELDKKNKEALLALFDFYLEAPSAVGGGVDKAEKLAAAIESLYPGDGARSWAAIYEKQEQLDLAEKKLRSAVDLEPEDVGHVLSLASFLARRARYDESDKLYQKAASMAPNSPEVWFSRAKSLVRAKRNPAEARELLQRYVKADLPPDATARSEARELLKQI